MHGAVRSLFPRTMMNSIWARALTTGVAMGIPLGYNGMPLTPNSRMVPGGGGPTRASLGPQGESPAGFAQLV